MQINNKAPPTEAPTITPVDALSAPAPTPLPSNCPRREFSGVTGEAVGSAEGEGAALNEACADELLVSKAEPVPVLLFVLDGVFAEAVELGEAVAETDADGERVGLAVRVSVPVGLEEPEAEEDRVATRVPASDSDDVGVRVGGAVAAPEGIVENDAVGERELPNDVRAEDEGDGVYVTAALGVREARALDVKEEDRLEEREPRAETLGAAVLESLRDMRGEVDTDSEVVGVSVGLFGVALGGADGECVSLGDAQEVAE